jgi:hypothetical protein
MTRPVRCGWCITGDHDNCLVIMIMGETRSRNDKKATGPYPWRCPCGCLRSVNTKCLNCQRVGVEVTENRCTDERACKRWRGKIKQTRVIEVRV